MSVNGKLWQLMGQDSTVLHLRGFKWAMKKIWLFGLSRGTRPKLSTPVWGCFFEPIIGTAMKQAVFHGIFTCQILTPNLFKDHRTWGCTTAKIPSTKCEYRIIEYIQKPTYLRANQRTTGWILMTASNFRIRFLVVEKNHWEFRMLWIILVDFQAGTVWYRFLRTFFANAVVFAAANWGCCWNHHQMLKVRCMIIYHFINEGCRCHIAIKSGADDRRRIDRDRTSQFRGPNSTRTFLSPYVYPCVLWHKKQIPL